MVNKIIKLKNGDILVGGKFTSFDTHIVGNFIKLKSDGTLHEDFGRNLGLAFNGEVKNFEVQNDGSIIVLGDFEDFNGNQVGPVVLLSSSGTFVKTLANHPSDGSKITAVASLIGKGLMLLGIDHASEGTAEIIKTK